MDIAREYEFQIESFTSKGSKVSKWTRASTAEQRPDLVIPPRVTSKSSSYLNVQIRQPLEPNGKILAYDLVLDGTSVGVYDRHQAVVLDRLTPSSTYSLALNVCTKVGCTLSNVVTESTSEGNPTGLNRPVAVALSSSTAAIAWNKPAEPNGIVTSYAVYSQELGECAPTSTQFDTTACKYLVCPVGNEVCGARCFDPATHTCCNGALHATTADSICCGINYVPDTASNAVCCGDHSYAFSPGHKCCGDNYKRFGEGEICCSSQVGEGNECCGEIAFTTSESNPKICCGGRVYDDLKTRQCCGDSIVPATSVCCAGVAHTPVDGMECCGTSYSHSDTTVCCDDTPHVFATALAKAADTRTCCSTSLILSELGCCHGKGYDPDSETCADRSTDSTSDRICGVGVVCPASHGASAFCDSCTFDSAGATCTAINQPSVGVVSSAFLVASDGAVLHDAGDSGKACTYMVCGINENVCGTECFGDNKACCDGVLHDAQSGFRCCGTDYLEAASEDVCCAGTFFAREADKSCCGGTYQQVSAGEVCCDGVVGTGNECCGSVSFTNTVSDPKMCCGGLVHDASPSFQCCGGELVGGADVCCGGTETGVAHPKSPFMECCGSAYISSASSLCCENSIGSAISYGYSSPGEKARSGDTCCDLQRVGPGMGCCNGEEYDPKVSVCADISSNDQPNCGGGALCPLSKKDTAFCDVCDFDSKTQMCGVKFEPAAEAQQLCPMAEDFSVETTNLNADASNLKAFTPYQFLVEARTSGGMGRSPKSHVLITDQGVPSDIFAPDVVAVNASSINVSWTAPGTPNGVVLSYKIYDAGTPGKNTTLVESSSPGSKAVYGLEAYSLQRFFAVVCTKAGCGNSGVGEGRTSSIAPEGVVAPRGTGLAGGDKLAVQWDLPKSVRGVITSYTVIVDGDEGCVSEAAERECIIDGLKPFTKHAIALKACTAGGCSISETSQAITTQASPSAPLKAPALFVLGPKRIEVTWSEPVEPNGIIANYSVRRDGVLVYTGLKMEFVDSGVSANSKFTYTYVATTAGGGTVSLPASINTPESSPDGVSTPTCVATSSTAVDIKWEPPESPNGRLTGYRLQRDDETPVEKPDLAQRVHTDTGLKPYSNYSYRVEACTFSGCAYSERCTVVTLEAPPVGLSEPIINNANSTSISLQWDAPSAPNGQIRFYTLMQDGEEGGVITIYNGTARRFDSKGLRPYTTYRFTLVAGNGAGTVASGSSRGTTAEAAPVDVSQLTVSEVTATEAKLSWNRPSTPNGVMTRYEVHSFTGADSDAVLYNGTELSASIKLRPNVKYELGLVAFTSAGGAKGPTIVVTTPEGPPGDAGVLKVFSVNSTSVSLGWSDPVESNGAIVLVKLSLDGDVLYNGTDKAFTVNGLQPFTKQSFVLTACTSAGCTDNEPREVTTAEDVPAGVSDPFANAVSATEISLTWSAPAHPNGIVEKYEIYRGSELVFSGGTTSFADSGLTPYTDYIYQLVAVNGAGAGRSSGSPAGSHVARTLEALPIGLEAPTVLSAPESLALSWALPATPNGKITRYVLSGREVREEPLAPAVLYDGPETAFTVTKLAPLSDYEFMVEAYNGIGSVASDFVQGSTCSPSPARLDVPAVSDVTDNTAVLTWSPPEELDATLERYIVLIDGVEAFSGLGTSFTVTDLLADNDYEFQLEACVVSSCNATHACTRSESVSAHTSAGAPQGVYRPRAVPLSSSSIDVSWRIPARPNGNITKYQLFRGETVVYEGLELHLVDSGLAPNTEHVYRLKAFTEGGSTVSTVALASTLAPGTPLGLKAPSVAVMGAAVVEVCWEAPTVPNGRIDAYAVTVDGTERYRGAPRDSPCEYIGGLHPYSEIEVRVKACNARGCGVSLGVAARTKCDAPQEPHIAAELLDGTSAVVSWTAPLRPHCDSTSYSVQWSVDSIPGDDAAPSFETPVPAGETEITVKHLAHNRVHFLRLVATNVAGDTMGAWTTIQTTESSPVGVAGPAVEQRSPTTVFVSWRAPDHPNGAGLVYSLRQNGEVLSTDSSTYRTVDGITPYTNYTFVVEACTSLGCTDGPATTFLSAAGVPSGVSVPTVFAVESRKFLVGFDAPSIPNGVIEKYEVLARPCLTSFADSNATDGGCAIWGEASVSAVVDPKSAAASSPTTAKPIDSNATAPTVSPSTTWLVAVSAGIVPYTLYSLKLEASTAAGMSGSAWIDTWQTADGEVVPIVTSEGAPEIIDGSAVMLSTGNRLICDWTGVFQANGELTEYTVEIQGGGWMRTWTVEPAATVLTYDPLGDGSFPEEATRTMYSCMVIATNSAGSSAPAASEQVAGSLASEEEAVLAEGSVAVIVILLLGLAVWAGYTIVYGNPSRLEEFDTRKGLRGSEEFWAAEEEAMELVPALKPRVFEPGEHVPAQSPVAMADISPAQSPRRARVQMALDGMNESKMETSTDGPLNSSTYINPAYDAAPSGDQTPVLPGYSSPFPGAADGDEIKQVRGGARFSTSDLRGHHNPGGGGKLPSFGKLHQQGSFVATAWPSEAIIGESPVPPGGPPMSPGQAAMDRMPSMANATYHYPATDPSAMDGSYIHDTATGAGSSYVVGAEEPSAVSGGYLEVAGDGGYLSVNSEVDSAAAKAAEQALLSMDDVEEDTRL